MVRAALRTIGPELRRRADDPRLRARDLPARGRRGRLAPRRSRPPAALIRQDRGRGPAPIAARVLSVRRRPPCRSPPPPHRRRSRWRSPSAAPRRRRVPRHQRRARLRGQGERVGRDPAGPARAAAARGGWPRPASPPTRRSRRSGAGSRSRAAARSGSCSRTARACARSPSALSRAATRRGRRPPTRSRSRRGYAGDRDLYSVGADGNARSAADLGRAPTTRRPPGARAGSIAFVRDGDVYLKAPGRRARPLTGGAADDRDPAWSPDGRRIAFTRLPERAAPRRRRKKGRKRSAAPRVRELWVMRATAARRGGSQQLPAGVSAPAWSPDGRRSRSRWAARAAAGSSRSAATGRGAAPGRLARRRPAALDWQPRGGDPVIAAAGDIACDPDLTRFAHRPRHARRLPHAADLGPADEDGPVGRAAARRPPVRERHAGQVPALLRPDLGPPEGADAPRRRATTSTARRARRATSTTSTAPASSTARPARATRATTATTSAPGTS